MFQLFRDGVDVCPLVALAKHRIQSASVAKMAVISTLKCLVPKINILNNGSSANYLRSLVLRSPSNTLREYLNEI